MLPYLFYIPGSFQDMITEQSLPGASQVAEEGSTLERFPLIEPYCLMSRSRQAAFPWDSAKVDCMLLLSNNTCQLNLNGGQWNQQKPRGLWGERKLTPRIPSSALCNGHFATLPYCTCLDWTLYKNAANLPVILILHSVTLIDNGNMLIIVFVHELWIQQGGTHCRTKCSTHSNMHPPTYFHSCLNITNHLSLTAYTFLFQASLEDINNMVFLHLNLVVIYCVIYLNILLTMCSFDSNIL